MRVNQSGAQPAQGSEVSKSKKSAQTQSAEGGKSSKDTRRSHESSGDAKTEISDRSKDMKQARDIAAKAPDVREDRVAELRKRIAEGNYHVDAEAVADRLVEDHLKMPGA